MHSALEPNGWGGTYSIQVTMRFARRCIVFVNHDFTLVFKGKSTIQFESRPSTHLRGNRCAVNSHHRQRLRRSIPILVWRNSPHLPLDAP